ncbi:MAG TPA: cytochrome ubiquinol oxidase subunit I [Terriglobales bacterium]
MDSALLIHRLQFAFTITYHYLFPQLTMGLAPLIVILKTLAIKKNDETYDQAARFWARIFAINFAIGVVTGIPMEFQFGTNWSHFSRFAGGVIGQTLAMEGCFAFFLESTFSWPLSKTPEPRDALAGGFHGVRRFVGVGLFHCRHRRLDAEPCRLREGR